VLPLALVLVLGASAFIAVALLQEHADSSRQAELKLGQLQLALGNVNALEEDALGRVTPAAVRAAAAERADMT
jgi:hypothetical protein